MTKQNSLTLGSLFDGIGGFPYAASFYGIKTLWASEILSTAVSVTNRHFPYLEHVGDITQLDGAKLAPVDIITFGSPCQGLSMAGRRLGLADERSGLFSEAIRIIREMQEATNGEYPKIALWENVPGALSTAGGRDFRAVIEAFTAAKVPMPESGKWANAGMVRGRGVDIAWCVYNAQYFGVAQRRRRIFLVADFTGQRAGEILFVPKSLRRYFEAGGTPRQVASSYAESRPGTADAGVSPAITMRIRQGCDGGGKGALLQNEKTGALSTSNDQYLFSPVEILNDQGGNSLSIEKDGVSPTLRSETHGNLPVVAHTPANNCLNGWDTQQSRIYTEDGQAPTLAGADGGGGRNPAGLVAAFIGGAAPSAGGIGYSKTVAPTLRGASGSNLAPCVCGPEQVLCAATGQANAEILENRSATIVAGHAQPYIAHPKADGAEPSGINGDVAGTLDASYYKGTGARSGKEREVVLCRASGQSNAEQLENLSATLNCGAEQPIIVHPGDEAFGFDLQQITSKQNRSTLKPVQPVLCSAGNPHVVEAHPQVSGTLCGSGAGLSRPAGMASETDLCVVAAVDCRNLKENGDLSGTLQSKTTPGYSLNYQNPVRILYIVRRLTPTECERLQGYPDGWTLCGHDGKPISDTKRYQMLGNSIAVPCAAYIMQGIVIALLPERR